MNNCIGIDISKNTFDVHFGADGFNRRFDYNCENIEKAVGIFLAAGPELIVMEATGGYETDLASELQAAGLPVAVVNPRRVRDFAKAIGRTAKTDKIDARVIAEFGATLQPPPSAVVDETTRKIKALTSRKRQLKEFRVAEKNHAEHGRDEIVEQSIAAVLSAIDSQIALIEEQIRLLVDSSPELKRKAEIVQSFKGVGENTAAALISGLPEIGQLNRREIASLTGTAPINRDSGQFRGKRMTGGGRCEIRTMLYMPTLVAIQHNPVIREFYNRLVAAGKAKMVAVVACMRKILVILNSMVKNNKKWEPKIS
jgi:transposase